VVLTSLDSKGGRQAVNQIQRMLVQEDADTLGEV
jgi:hypothetical protein